MPISTLNNGQAFSLHSIRRPCATRVVWIGCVVVTAIAWLAVHSGVLSEDIALRALGASHEGIFRRIWLHQLASFIFLHHNLVHLVFNVIGLCSLGAAAEQCLGFRRCCWLILLSAAGTAICFALIDWNGQHTLLGAAPVLYGLLAALTWYRPNDDIVLLCIRIKVKYSIAFLVALEMGLAAFAPYGALVRATSLVAVPIAWCFLVIERRVSSRHQHKSSLKSRYATYEPFEPHIG